MGSFIAVACLFITKSWNFTIGPHAVLLVEPCDLCFTALVYHTAGSSETHALTLEFEVHKQVSQLLRLMTKLFDFNKTDFLVLCKTARDLLRHSKVSSVYIKQVEWAVVATAIFRIRACINNLIFLFKSFIRLLIERNKFLKLNLLLEWLVLRTQRQTIFFVLAFTNFRLQIKTFFAEVKQKLSLVI